MRDLSILIPARNERWLTRTVRDVLEHAKGRTDVIVVLDGAWPEEPLPLHPRLHVIYHPAPVGQRAAVNEAARVSTARYVMKLDAHCALEDGFDLQLVAAAETLGRNVLQVPAQKNLHVFDWHCEGCGWSAYQGPTPPACPSCGGAVKQRIVWKPRRGTTTTCWRFDETLHFQYWKEGQSRQTGDYPETLSLLGACWFLDRQWFLDELDGLDEAHGSWGQMGTELACKAWLSGGRVVCNRTTWFAHLFRTQGGDFGFPYEIRHSEQEAARAYSRQLWLRRGWPKQTRTLYDLLAAFAPVPGWTGAAVEAVGGFTVPDEDEIGDGLAVRVAIGDAAAETSPSHAPAPSAGILYYSDSRGDDRMLEAVRQQLRHAAGGMSIVAVTLPAPDPHTSDREGWAPLDEFAGTRHVVLPLRRGYLTMARQILTGMELLDTDVVFFCEHDCLYPPDYFAYRPPAGVYAYAANTWKVDAVTGRALTYKMEQLSGLCADRALLLDHFRRRVAHLEAHGFSRRLGFEPGKPIRHGGLDDVPRITWYNPTPIVDIRHGDNLTPSRWSRDQFRNQKYTDGWTEAEAVPGWGHTAGRFPEWLDEVTRHG